MEPLDLAGDSDSRLVRSRQTETKRESDCFD